MTELMTEFSVQYTLKDIRRLSFLGLIDRPILNILAILIPSLLVYYVFGTDSIVYIASTVITFVLMLTVFPTYYGYYLYKNKNGLTPVKITIEDKAIRLTYGDSDSKIIYTVVVKINSVRKIWIKNKTIIIGYKIFGYGILLSDKDSIEALKTLRAKGWPVK